MQSMTDAVPSGVTNSVSSTRESFQYQRCVELISLGAMRQKPLPSSPNNDAKHAGESKRGMHSQSMEPPLSTSAAVSRSPMRAYSSIRFVMQHAAQAMLA